jgi:asparagine synthase (glutamine-hydrolysing)
VCGIAGYANLAQADLLGRMLGRLGHRGPDDQGMHRVGTTGLGVSRLSIIDLAGGHQPITSEDGSLVIGFNGEIYNYRELSARLADAGHRFATRSDTETVLHLYEEYGPACLDHLRGMFAFAIHDVRRDRLFLARDRLGVKPLYYWARNGRLVFASEIKAILECDHVPREPHAPSVDAYLSLRYVPGPETMFTGIRKLPAGHWMTWEAGELRLERYWIPQLSVGEYRDDAYYEERFAELLTESVQLRLMSEVPLGAFLSGGIDSTAIVATMSRLLNRAVKTFSVGFDWRGDELPAAREVAGALGCEHQEVICRPDDMQLLPRIVWHLDEPVGDAIVVPMYLLSRLARQHVTVVLTGEGADEVLAGYLPHKVMVWTRHYVRWVPSLMRRWLVEPALRSMPAGMLNLGFSYPARLGGRGRQKVLDFVAVAGQRSIEREYLALISLFDERDKAALYGHGSPLRTVRSTPFDGEYPGAERAPYVERVLALQYRHWLPDDILMKQDKMTMANSVEGREPFLDHPLVEFLLQTPPHLKLRRLVDKVLLRRYVARLLPPNVARRPKQAFYVPVDRYLKAGPLREITETCLSETAVRRRGYFDWQHVRALREKIGRGDFLFGKQVLSLIVLELWHRIFIDREAGWVS